jgi:cytochrome P450
VPLLRRLTAEHGDPIRIPTRAGPTTYTGDPEAIRAVYTADPDVFGVRAVNATAPILGRTSLAVSTGEQHRRARKLLAPPFNAGTMRAYGAAMVAAARAAAAPWVRERPFSMLEIAQSIALDVIVRVVFGMEGEERVRRTRAAVLRLIDSMSPAIFLFPKIRRHFLGLGPWARFQRASSALDALLLEQIRARRAAPHERQDILSLLVSVRDEDGRAMEDAALVEQLRTLLFAGHETTATAMAWAMYWLHREPGVLARALEEIDALGAEPAPDALASLPFLEATCFEALRMHPPVVEVGRTTQQPFPLGRYTVPAGEAIVPSPILLHAREDLYPNPDRFQPERFLSWKPSPFEFIPFGGGSKRCLGAAFAMYEMKVVLGTLLHENRLRLVSEAPIQYVRRGITMGPKGGVPMVLEARIVKLRKPLAP